MPHTAYEQLRDTMNAKLTTKRTFLTIAALFVFVVLTQSANAIVLSYEEGPDVGQAFIGTVAIKIQGFVAATYYQPTSLPSAGVGYSGSPGANVAGGIVAVNSVSGQTPPAHSSPGIIVPAFPEDTWGIVRVSQISDSNTGFKVWSSVAKGTEITGILYGKQDFFVRPDPRGCDRRLMLW